MQTELWRQVFKTTTKLQVRQIRNQIKKLIKRRAKKETMSPPSSHLPPTIWNSPAAAVNPAHDDLSTDKRSPRTQTHHDQSMPVKGNLAYWCPFHSSLLNPPNVLTLSKYGDVRRNLCEARNPTFKAVFCFTTSHLQAPELCQGKCFFLSETMMGHILLKDASNVLYPYFEKHSLRMRLFWQLSVLLLVPAFRCCGISHSSDNSSTYRWIVNQRQVLHVLVSHRSSQVNDSVAADADVSTRSGWGNLL